MPYDPTLPANNSPVASAELRSQLQGLMSEINQRVNLATLPEDVSPFTSGACDIVASLGLTVSNPPTQAEVQSLADKLDELLNVLKRL